MKFKYLDLVLNSGILLIVGEGEGEYVNPQGARRGGVSTSGSDSNFFYLEVDN